MPSWPQLPLGEAVDVTMGRQRSPRHEQGDHLVPYLRAANVKDGRLLLGDVKEMNFTPTEQQKFALQEGDVLVTEGCGSIKELGASAAWTGKETHEVVCFQNTLLRLRAKPGLTIAPYVELWARHAHASGIWAGTASGTNIFHIGALRAATVPIPVPPVADQRRIATLIHAFDQVIAQADTYIDAHQAALSAHLTHRPECSTATDLGRLAHLSSGPSWKAADERRSADTTTTPVIGIKTTRPDGSLDLTERAFVTGLRDSVRRITSNSLVLIRTNGNRKRIGNTYRVPKELSGHAVSAFQILLEPSDPVLRDYLFWTLKAPDLQGQMSQAASGTTGLGNIALGWLKALSIGLPEADQRDRWTALAEGFQEAISSASQYRKHLVLTRASVLGGLLSGDRIIPESFDHVMREVA